MSALPLHSASATGRNNVPGIVLFGDSLGLKAVLPLIPAGRLSALVGAANRPQYQTGIQQLAKSHGVPCLQQVPTSHPSYVDFERDLLDIKPDIILVYSYSMRIPDIIIAAPQIAAVNVHGGPLPEYRGCNPIQWAIASGDSVAGVSMHLLSSEFDAGPLLAQRRFGIGAEDCWPQVARNVHALAAQLLAENLPPLLKGDIKPILQNDALARYWPRRTPADSVFHWSWPCRKIYNCIRASVAPLHGAFYHDVYGQKIIFDQFMPLAEVVRYKLNLNPYILNGILFSCSPPNPTDNHGILRLNLQIRGQKICTAVLSNFINTSSAPIAVITDCNIPMQTINEVLKKFITLELETISPTIKSHATKA